MAPTAQAPIARYPVPFGSPKECKFSFPERSNETIKPVRNSTQTVRVRPMIEINIPIMGLDGKRTGVSILATLWRERKSTPEGEQETFSFSIPDRTVCHTYQTYTPKSDDYYAAKDVFNGWRGELVNAALEWLDKQPESRKATVGGSVARLVKQTDPKHSTNQPVPASSAPVAA